MDPADLAALDFGKNVIEPTGMLLPSPILYQRQEG
jgi:hypothetical protein